MSNSTSTPVQYFGVFYLHPKTGKRCGIARTFTSRKAAQRACDNRNSAWGNINYFPAEVSA